MSRAKTQHGRAKNGFPRVSGDEPAEARAITGVENVFPA